MINLYATLQIQRFWILDKIKWCFADCNRERDLSNVLKKRISPLRSYLVHQLQLFDRARPVLIQYFKKFNLQNKSTKKALLAFCKKGFVAS
ncbi:hypothetical protein C5473_00040 [Leptospira interrogans serovar Weerasinghe]|nr:hypothetical protein C5473_21600 [Leptospira interrogans serovar Weerasinghe]KAA1266640.1 hypothetical protein C5473_00040 [Leptospira interrogans serovar Weerasinghe]